MLFLLTRIIRYKGQPIRDIVYLSEKLRDMTLWKLVFLDEIRDSWEHDEAASEMQGRLYSLYTGSIIKGCVTLMHYYLILTPNATTFLSQHIKLLEN